MIICLRCGKDNQQHYKFCLGCGAELPRESNRPRSFSAPSPAESEPAKPSRSSRPPSAAPAPRSSAPPAAAISQPPAELASCPQCNTSVPSNFRFCHTCGHDMTRSGAGSSSGAPAAAPTNDAQANLVLIRPDGSEGERFPLGDQATLVGRAAGGLFESDVYLSPEHAEFRFDGGELLVQDLGSLNGIYIRVPPEIPIELYDGSVFRIGQQILRFEAATLPDPPADGTQPMGSPNQGHLGRLRLLIGRNSHGNSFVIPPHGLHLGRERGDAIFPEDGYVSGLHCRIHVEVGHVYLTDVGSSNGTFVRVIGESAVPAGTFILMGQQLFRADY